MALRVKNTFLTAEPGLDCDGDGNFTLDVAYRQYSAPAPQITGSLTGASPLRHLWSSYDTPDFFLDKAKELPAEGPQRQAPLPQSEPEGEPHVGTAGAAACGGAAAWAPAFEEDFSHGISNGGHAQQQHLPKSVLVGGRQACKEAPSPKRSQPSHHRVRVSFHELDEPEAGGEAARGALPGDGSQEELDEPEVFPWSRLVTGGSEYASDTANASPEEMQRTMSAMAPYMPTPYFAGMSQEGAMPMMPMAMVPNGMCPPSQSYLWPGQGLYPLPQEQQQGMLGPSQASTPPKQAQGLQDLQGVQQQEGQSSARGQSSISSTPRISPSTRHSRGRGSLIDLAKREQAQRQQTPSNGRSINFCPYCRGKVQAHHRFCQFCGASLNLF